MARLDPLIFMAQPPPAIRARMEAAVAANGLDERLGAAQFEPGNWHQSFSDRQDDQPKIRAAMLRAGARVAAPSFVMTLNRINGTGVGPRGIHWAFRTLGKPKGLEVMLSAVRAALLAEGILDDSGHGPQVTISYKAPTPLPSVVIEPIEWMVDELLLVRGGGQPYRYEVVGRWPLAATPPKLNPQLGLLEPPT